MKLFTPDIFSVSRPAWLLVTDEFTIDRIEEKVYKFLPNLVNEGLKILKSGGNEINSANYLIEIGNNRFLLKNWGHDKNINSIEGILDIQEWLNSQGQPVVKSINGEFGRVIEDDIKYKWSMFPFIDGCYYSGSGNQFEKAVQGSISLHHALKDLPGDISPPSGHDYFTIEEINLVDTISTNRHEWKYIFSPETIKILENYWNFIANEWMELFEGRSARPTPFGVKPSHFDLHPHNILFDSGNLVGILDFESCRQIQSEYAIFFSILKLARQKMVSNYSKINIEKLLGGEINNKLMYEYSVIEVIRRLLIILKNDMNADRKWLHVLLIQVRLIFEAKEIFLNKTI
jgi:hypothetical protein